MVTNSSILPHADTITSTVVVASEYYLPNGRSADAAFTVLRFYLGHAEKLRCHSQKALRSACRVEQRVCRT